jgi:hypothetical protein
MNDELINLPDNPGGLNVPSEMIAEIAAGLEDPKDIAFRYGIAGKVWTDLEKWVPFQNAVAAQKAEFEKSGYTFKVKAKVLTEDVFEDAYRIARANNTTLLQKLEFVKLGAKLADMEPKQNTQVQAGPGFSITINLGEAPKAKTIDVTPHVTSVTTTDTDEPNIHTPGERQELPSQ